MCADFAKFEAIMTFMESLIGMHFIRYVGSNMWRIIMETIFLAASLTDWQSCQLPESVHSRAHQMLLTLSNIHNIQNFGSTQSDQIEGDVAGFLAGVVKLDSEVAAALHCQLSIASSSSLHVRKLSM